MVALVHLGRPQKKSESTHKYALVSKKDQELQVRQSGAIPRDTFVPQLLHRDSVPALLEAFDDCLGYAFDGRRLIRALGYPVECFPRLLAPLLVMELSKKVHSERRLEFVDRARSVLHF